MDNSPKEIYYFRIQNHLRKMGLARESLRVCLCHEFFRKQNVCLNLIRPLSDAPEAPSAEDSPYFEKLFQTVKSEVETLNSEG